VWAWAEELETAQDLLASGDVPGLLRHLRAHGEALPLGEVARLVSGAARLAGFEDLAQAAPAVADGWDGADTQYARAPYDFGYACIERGPVTGCQASGTRTGPSTGRRAGDQRLPGSCGCRCRSPSRRTGVAGETTHSRPWS
jgi:hypothetical protein